MVSGAASLLVGVGDLAGGSVVAADGQDALVSGDDYRAGGAGAGDVLAADGDAGDAGFGDDRHGTGDGIARAFDHAVVGSAHAAVAVLGRDDRKRIGLTGDGDGQRGGAGTAFTVRDGIGDRAGCRLAGS